MNVCVHICVAVVHVLFVTLKSLCAFVGSVCGSPVGIYVCIYGQAWLRPLMVITFAILFTLFLQVLQFRLIHHLLHQVFLPAHAITQVFGHVWNHVGYEGFNAKHQVLWRIQQKMGNS